MNKNKIIIGIVGEMASGKTTVTNYLKQKYQATTFRFSDMLREILDRLYLEQTRTNMQNMSTTLRQSFGEEIMSKVLVQDLKKSSADIIVTEGIRRPSDTVHLKALSGFHIIALNAEEKIRFQRITQRVENTDDQKKTWEEFQKEGQQESEQKIKQIAKQANFTINNNGTLENLYKQIDIAIEKMLH